MHNELCERLGIEFPIFAFTHCRDVAAAVSNTGGLGVLGAVGLQRRRARGRADLARRARRRPPLRGRHRHPRQVRGHGRARPGQARGGAAGDDPRGAPHLRQEDPGRPRRARARGRPAPRAAGLDGGHRRAAGRRHPAPRQGQAGGQRARARRPTTSSRRCTTTACSIAALAGSVKHALNHKAAGVDIVICQGSEGGGHTGDVGLHRAVARGHRRGRSPAGARRRRRRDRAARWRPPWSWAPPASGRARCG